jgi:AMP nucleosidase
METSKTHNTTLNAPQNVTLSGTLTPIFIAPGRFTDAEAAVKQIQAIYDNSLAHLRTSLDAFVAGTLKAGRVRACYPFVRLRTQSLTRQGAAPKKLSFGFVQGVGTFETTITKPDLFESYLLKQLDLLLKNHGGELEVGTSNEPIPIHFSFADHDHVEGNIPPDRRALMRDVFDLPDLGAMNDDIANGTFEAAGRAQPLSLFTAPRIDYSLHRLRHYTGTSTEHFQNYVLLTNYQFYIDEFVNLCRKEMANPQSEYVAFVEPGNVVTRRVGLPAEALDALGKEPPRLPQMPAYHLVRKDAYGNHSGVTMVNIGVGPANAKNITDHIAVLRPHAWLMLGHCAGLRNSQELGDYVLAHAYVRDDHVLDEDLPLWVPIPALAEVQVALQQAVAEVANLPKSELKQLLRTGTVASTDNRNWELLDMRKLSQRFNQSRAIALDMESATIAANGFRFRVPYGTLLCVSDKPLHGEIKLPGMANQFYRDRVDQHLRIGMRAVEILRELGAEQLHSRKLRSFAEVAFQ